MAELNTCSIDEITPTPRWNTAWRFSGFCLFLALTLTLALFIIGIVVGGPNRMGPLFDSGLTLFGWCFVATVMLGFIGLIGRVGIFFLRRISA